MHYAVHSDKRQLTRSIRIFLISSYRLFESDILNKTIHYSLVIMSLVMKRSRVPSTTWVVHLQMHRRPCAWVVLLQQHECMQVSVSWAPC